MIKSECCDHAANRANKTRPNRTQKIVRLNYIQVKRFALSEKHCRFMWKKTQRHTHTHTHAAKREDINRFVFSTIVNVNVRIRVNVRE